MSTHRNATAEIARDTERSRANLEQTLYEIRHRMTPGRIMDEALDYAKDSGGGDFVRNLGHDLRNSPLPVALIGAGIAWLIYAHGRPPQRAAEPQPWPASPGAAFDGRDHAADGPGYGARARELAHDARDAAGRYGRAAAGTASGLAAGAQELGAQVKDAAGNVVAGAADAATSARDAVASGYGYAAGSVRRTGASLREGAQHWSGRAHDLGRGAGDLGSRASDRFLGLLREQPLLFGALGVAVGAAIGASFAATRTENRWMGDSSDRVKDRAGELASEGFDQAAAAAERVYEKGMAEAREQGLTPEGATASLQDVGEKVSAVAGSVKEGLEEEMARPKERDRRRKPAESSL